jgi:hypothetical protein
VRHDELVMAGEGRQCFGGGANVALLDQGVGGFASLDQGVAA